MHGNNPRPQQPPPQHQLTIQELLNIYAFFNNLPNPSATIQECKTKLETHIANFINSLKSTGPTQ
jgi:hypothetical protein